MAWSLSRCGAGLCRLFSLGPGKGPPSLLEPRDFSQDGGCLHASQLSILAPVSFLQWRKFKNPARGDGLELEHWVKCFRDAQVPPRLPPRIARLWSTLPAGSSCSSGCLHAVQR